MWSPIISLSSRGFVPVSLALVLALAACSTRGSDRRGGGDSGTTDSGGGSDTTGRDVPGFDTNFPMETDDCQKMDILFVIDDSGSMGEEQTNLASNFPRFVEVLDAFRTSAGTELDYRIGVTTTGVDVRNIVRFDAGGLPFPIPFPDIDTMEEGPDGALLAGCGIDRSWIERSDPDVTGAFSCRANVGTSGSPVEMPLKALELSVTERITDGANAGFLREDALLAVVILTDEDDCSHNTDVIEQVVSFDTSSAADECDPELDTIVPIADVVRAIDAAKGDRGRWAVSIIAGPGPSSCESSFGSAAYAERLQTFLGDVGENTSFSSICEGDLAGGLMSAIDTFDAACQAFPPLI